MRLGFVGVVLMALMGCVPEYGSVDEGCEGGLPGAGTLGDASADTLERVNCYRRYLGLAGFGVDGNVQAAVQNHVDYLVVNKVLGDEVEEDGVRRSKLIEEAPGQTAYTGTTPFDRNVATGSIANEDVLSPAMVWGWFLHEASMSGDELIANPYVRDMVFQPTVTGVGYAEAVMVGSKRAYFDVVSRIPSGVRVSSPIVYPKDGQTGVPTSWTDVYATVGEVSASGTIGFPITITISGQEVSDDVFDPFGIEVVTATLSTEDGRNVPVLLDVPELIRTTVLRTTVIIAPREPLEENTTYVVDAEIDTKAFPYTVRSTFTTGVGFDVE